MARRFVLNAYSSNSGGGRTGLLSLLSALPQDVPTVVFVDSRLSDRLSLPQNVTIERVEPKIVARIRAEKKIRELVAEGGWLLRLGSVPPFFKLRAPSFVFFENRHLLKGTSLEGMPLKRRARVLVERALVRTFSSNATAFVVQSESMASELKLTLGATTRVHVLPFHSTHGAGKSGLEAASVGREPPFDFIYPSTGDAHKNHRNLVLAWQMLAREGLTPSLCLTLDPSSYPALSKWIKEVKAAHGLRLANAGFLDVEELARHYQRSKAMIFPSTCESFGRPLVEARDMGLPILASERDYVRDVCDPVESFDPESPISIARAVKRFLGVREKRAPILAPAEFLMEIRHKAEGRSS